jgi:HSP20 family protein
MFDVQEFMSPACDIEETQDHYLVSFDLPGIPKDKLRIELKDDQLIVSGERKEERREEVKNRVSSERYYGSLQRSFTLPSAVDPSKVEAHYQDGVLRVAVPKTPESEAAKPKQVQIKEGKEGFFGKLLGHHEKAA